MSQSERHARVSAIFLSLCDLPAAGREGLLAEACAGDESLRREVEAMLEADRDERFLPIPAREPEETPLPERIGSFLVRRLLGRGGSAVVYEAEQARPARRVAVKVLRRTWATAEATRRLLREAESLARLQHPGVATVYEVGTFEGSPYIAMELVEGETLAAYTTRAIPPAGERLELLAEVCDAVHHAHQRGVIHRDLKPSNILIDGEGRPKIIDFGIARILDADPSATLVTSPGQIVGTLAYVSPEQLNPGGIDVDTRADVFALGVILFELLSGRRPREAEGGPVARSIALLRDQAPMRLRKALPSCPRDLDAIVGKALAINPDDRYASAAALADDIRRYLRDETISARAPSAIYEVGKFVRRRRALVLSTMLGVALLIAGVAVGLTQWSRALRAERARDAAMLQTQTRVAKAFSSILAPVAEWAKSESGRAGKGLELARSISAASLAQSFPDDPAAESDYHRSLGSLFLYQFGYPEVAVEHLQRALDASRRAGQARHESTVKLMQLLGIALIDARRSEEAESILIEAAELAPSARLDAPDSMAIIHRQIGNAQAAQRKFDAAAESYSRAVGLLRAARTEPGLELVEALGELGNCLRQSRRLSEAAEVLREAFALCHSLGDEPAAARFARLLGRVERDSGNFDEALRLQTAALEQSRLRPGASRQYLASALGDLAHTYTAMNKLDEAELKYREALDAMRRASRRWLPNEETYLAELAALLERQPDRAADAESVRAELDQVRAELGRKPR